MVYRRQTFGGGFEHRCEQATPVIVSTRDCSLNHERWDFVHQRSPTAEMWVGASKRKTEEGEKIVWTDNRKTPTYIRQLNFTKLTETASDSSSSASCVKVNANGLWRLEDCDVKLPFLCQRYTPCEAGWFGHQCDRQCHCYGPPCQSRDLIPVCPGGCLAGWMGDSCEEPSTLPEATYHCLRYPDGSLRASLKVNAKQRYFRHVQAVDESGVPLPCRLPVTRSGNLFYVHLSFFDDVTGSSTNESTTNPNTRANTTRDMVSGAECIASEPGNRSVTWFIEFRQYADLVTSDDVTVEVRCDADDVDDLDLDDVIYNAGGQETQMQASLEHLKVSVYLSEAGEDSPREQVHLGQTLQLHVHVSGLNEDECASPHSCRVEYTTPLNASKSQVALLDEHGCPTPRSVINRWTARSRDHFSSNPFPAFSIGEAKTLTVSCQVDFNLKSFLCPQPCSDQIVSSRDSPVIRSHVVQRDIALTDE
ncbi:hypothetical protein C0Q70_16774 [Pomacea canaliculata]|uniref:C-type lectin domain-containing protein n=1 Tax=Pomacea canaliculata TaxID=400727 RepID=A0A2T7NQS6_POMCA|nr:hypothetical protein C0Q70_16774 [Pomacea canaliculata]